MDEVKRERCVEERGGRGCVEERGGRCGRGRCVEREMCGEGDVWRERCVKREMSEEGDVWRGRCVEERVCVKEGREMCGWERGERSVYMWRKKNMLWKG